MFYREACYYVSKTKVDGYDAAAQCAMSASGARLAVAMDPIELKALASSTPNEQLWLGNFFNVVHKHLIILLREDELPKQT